MEILGYADRLSVKPGERIRFMVSTTRPSYRADIVHLAHAYTTPKPEGFTDPVVPTPVSGEYPGRHQPIHAGSYGIVEHQLDSTTGLTLQAWIAPALPADGRLQGLLTKRTGDGTGYGLLLDEQGRLLFAVGDGQREERLTTERTLRSKTWYFVAASYDAGTGEARLICEPVPRLWIKEPGENVSRSFQTGLLTATSAPFLLAGSHQETDAGGKQFAAGLYNGKLESPRVWGRALSGEEISALRDGAAPTDLAGLLAAWDFTRDFSGDVIHDISGNGADGRLINMPARAMTGHNWTGEDVSFRAVPEQYGAIHFHEDDLEDAGWEPDFELVVPEDLRSGIYAARLTSGDAEEYIPFYVRPAVGAPSSPIAYLAPTNTYLAYANERLYAEHDYTNLVDFEIELGPEDHYLHQHPELGLSLYDVHRDRSGVCYSSRLRPIVNMRPKYRTWLNAGARHFAADLHLIEWLEKKQFTYDVITDEDLHLDGADLLRSYKVILTGSHPEYWTTPMMEALFTYLGEGGRLMYLGGNGFYWVTGMDPKRPHVIEVRRGFAGTRCWESEPGETYLNLTGEPGGLWRYRGRSPQKVCGVGFTSQGWGGAAGYHRLPDSFDPRVAFIFEGIGEDEVIGDFGLIMGGAAGDELDRYDPDLGSPPETLRLATSEGKHTDYYQLTIEDAPMMLPGMGGTQNPKVRSDLTYTELPNGAAVFSVGSINWCGSLPTNDYDNNVSRLTENVLRRFMS